MCAHSCATESLTGVVFPPSGLIVQHSSCKQLICVTATASRRHKNTTRATHKQGPCGVMRWHRIQHTELSDGTAGVRNIPAAANRHHQHTPPLLLLPPLPACSDHHPQRGSREARFSDDGSQSGLEADGAEPPGSLGAKLQWV
jgi:hypothetical protein